MTDVFPESAELARRASRLLPGGITHDGRYQAPHPLYVTRAEGAYKWTVDDRRLIDYGMGHGALLLGHRHPAVEAAITTQLSKGTHFSAGNPLEVEWAQRVVDLVPSAELVRFTSTGTEATMLAFRLVRSFTGRGRILKLRGHFHGWHDEATVGFRPPFDTPSSAGVNPGVGGGITAIDQDDVESLAAELRTGDYAALIVEPTGASWGTVPLADGYLKAARELTAETGTVLIFDEVISCFRLAPGGAQALYGITPDLTCLAKILGGGLPAGAVAGRAAVVSQLTFTGDAGHDRFDRVFQNGTFNGNPMSAAAGVATLEVVKYGDVQRHADRLGARLREGLTQALKEAELPGKVTGLSSMFHIFIGDDNPSGEMLMSGSPAMRQIRSELQVEGVDLLGSGGMLSAAHTEEDIDYTSEAFLRVALRLAPAILSPA